MAVKRNIFEEVGTGGAAPLPQGGGIDRRGAGGARGAIRIWLMILFALVALMIAVGGATRLTDSGLSILAADNYAVEAQPARDPAVGISRCAALPLHQHCLFKLGVHLGELWWLTPLARWLREHRRHRFLLTAPPLRLPGAVGSPATPIATV